MATSETTVNKVERGEPPTCNPYTACTILPNGLKVFSIFSAQSGRKGYGEDSTRLQGHGISLHQTKEIPAQASPGTKDTSQDGGDSEVPDLTKDHFVPFTSRVIAAARAIESRRPDRLFNDCFAELLAGEESIRLCDEPAKIFMGDNESEPRLGEKGGEESSNEGGTNLDQCLDGTDAPSVGDNFKRQMAIRTKYGDDFFENCTLSPRNIKQIVLLGAGMDTRGYRLRAGPDTTVFEVDQALVLSYKREVLSGMSSQKMISDKKMDGCEARVIEVRADLEKTGWEDKLVEAGFNPALPSAWILEGLVMYLEKHDVAKLLQIVANHCSPGSAFCASTISEEWFERVRRMKLSVWKWGSDDPQPFFGDHFPRTWSWKYVTIGTPGEFPDGADYSVGFKGKGQGYVLGYAA